MSDVAIIAANVAPFAKDGYSLGVPGETVTAGLFLYLKPSDQLWYKADCLTLEKSGGGFDSGRIRMALSGGVAGQPIALANPGSIVVMNAVLQKGRTYGLSATATAGAMVLINELVNTNFLTRLGHAKSTTEFFFEPLSTGIVLS